MDGASGARIRFFFDITFFIIVTTIGLNIVFGIIVDTFSELRDEKVQFDWIARVIIIKQILLSNSYDVYTMQLFEHV